MNPDGTPGPPLREPAIREDAHGAAGDMHRVYRYPPPLRVLGLLGSMLAGGILLGSVLAEIEAADPLDLVLHVIGAIVGAAIVWLGLEFGMRRILLTPEGISTRLVREHMLRWDDVRNARAGPWGTLLIASQRGSPLVIWPFLQDFDALLDGIEAARREQRMSHA